MKKVFASLATLALLGVLIWKWNSPSRDQEKSGEATPSSRSAAVERGTPSSDASSTPTVDPLLPTAKQITAVTTPQAAAPIAAFREWAAAYLAAPESERRTMLPAGAERAKAHTQAIASMIRLDPQQAIANAVPMVVRQDLPESIVSLLENRVRLRAALLVNGNAPLPGQESSPDFKPYNRVVSTENGEYWNAYVYGKRGQQRSLSSTSINGISVGYDMAVADSPVRQLESGERPVPGDRPVVESCPVSEKETVVERTETGALPPITEETPAFETPERIIYVCSGGHIEQVAEQYSSEEERAHWESRGVTLNAGAGSGAPIDPISAIPGGSTTGQRSLLYIRVTYPDHLIDPQSEAECHDALRQMADWISQTSYGRLYYTYAVTPLIVLPYPESWYVQYQTDGASADSILRGHAITLARAAGYDNLAYDNEVIRWNGTVGSYGGSAGVGGRNINLKTNAVGTLLHELGHNLGLWHANYWQTNPPSAIGPGSNGEYGNTFDLLGNSGSMGQFTASFKNAVSWLPTETLWTVNSPGVYRIHQFDSTIQDPARRYALRIRKDTERDYWAEFRQLHTTNTGFMNGLMLTWDRWGQGGIGGSGGSPGNGSNGGAHLLDMTPGTFGNGITDTRNDSALWIGRTFSDTDANIHITPIAKNATSPPSMDVYVHTGDAPGNLAPTLSISASSTSVATNANVTFTATATDPNGDPLAYAWVFNDGTYSTNNSASQTKSWSTAGFYQVLCTASDMKGKRTTRSILVTVGAPTTFTVSGNITGPDSLPLEGVYVASHAPSNGTSHPNSSTFRGTWTDSDGNYTLTGLTAGSYSISPNLYPNVFTPSGFTNPLTVGPSTTAKNFSSASLPTITINVTDPVANEGSSPGTGTIRLERGGSTASALSVQIFNSNTGTATRNTDYSLSPAPTASTAGGGSGTSEYIIPAGASFLDIIVTPINDSSAEGTEYAALNFANTSGGYILVGSAVAMVEIVDDENSSLPVVKLTHLDNVASETGGDAATLLVERNGPTATNLTVNFTLSGTATNGTDYTIPSSVVIPSGSASATVTLSPLNDTAQEGTETATVTITTNAAYARDTLSNAQSLTIHDDDLPVVSIAATDATLTETPGDHGVFTISRTGGDPYLPLTVDYAISGRAVHGVDYRRLEGRSVIPAGASSITVEIYPLDDSVDEGTQNIILQLRSTTTYTIGGTGIATMSITDNDDSQVYVRLSQSGVIEPASGSTTAVSFQITRPISGSAITVNYAMSGTATNGVDYTTLPGTIAFAAADTTKTINVSALADTLLEDAESVTLTLLPGTGYTLMTSQNSSATGTIVDGDQPTIDVSAANTVTSLTTDGSETTASLRFIVSRDVSTATDLVVNYTMSGTATEGVDYTGTTGSITIPAGATSAYITLVPVNDTISEGVETIVMTITPSGTYGLRTPSSTMRLGDNDGFSSGSVAFASSTSSTNEAVGTHNVAVNVTGSPAGAISVNYRLSSGTATGGGYDYTLANGVLNFPPGTTSQNIPIVIHPDILMEPSETIVLQLFNVSGGNLGTSTHTVTLTNQSMPEAFTDAASNLLASSVTLNGRVIPNGLATNAWFEYGPTSTYGTTTTSQSIGSGTTSVNLTAPLSGFAPAGYHFRSVAQNSAGTTYGIRQIVSSNNASLTGLATNIGTFAPLFDSATQLYSVTVPSGTTTVTVTPTVSQANATVKVNGSSVASGAASGPIGIGLGTTTVTVVVTAQDGVTTKTYTLSIAPAGALSPQTINFAALSAATFGDAPVALTASASSGLPVSYSSSNEAVATVSGSTVTIVAAGSTNITATQSGNGSFEAASPVAQALVVNQASQTINFGSLASVLDNATPFSLSASASSGLTVSYASSNTSVATILGTTVTIVGPGTSTITASQAGNTNYTAAPSVPQTLTVGRANPLAVVTGSPYTVLIGQSLSLNGSTSLASFGETITTYEWDLNNDSVFGDVAGATPSSIPYAALTGTWGMVPGSNTIQLKITDSASKTSTVSATVQILVSLTWDSNGTTTGQTNGAGAWLGANQWWDGASNRTWAPGANAIFGGPSTAGGAVTLTGPTSLNAVTFNTFTGTYTLGTAAQTLTLSGGISKNSGTGAVSLISPITLGAPQTWTNNSTSDLGATSTLNNGGHILTFGGSGQVTFGATSSIISGAGGLTMNGTGRLQLGTASVPVHTYSGTTTLNAGVTMISNNNLGTGNLTLNGGVIESYWNTNFIRPLGSGNGEVQVIGGASGFALNGNTSVSVILGNNAANEAVWGSAVFNPSIFVLQTPASQTASALTFQNRIDLNGADRTIQVSGGTTGAASATISGIIRTGSGIAGLTKTGNGLLILSAANTYNGGTTISGGTLQIGNNTAGTLGNGTYNSNISIASGSNLRIYSSSNQTLGGVISGGGGLLKSYAGTLTLANSNTYSGKTSITPLSTAGAGVVNVSSFNSVAGGTASSSLGAPTTVANGTIDFGSTGIQGGATLRYTGAGETTDRVINFLFNGTGATKVLETSGSGLLKFTNTFTGSGSGTNDITLQGTSNGEIVGGLPFTFRNFAKSGSGTWTLGGAVGSSGTVTLNSGRLALGANQVLPNTAAVSIAAATLDAATFTDSMGTLDVTAAATINLGAGGALQFANSSAISWSGGSLAITGNFVPGSSLRFGTTSSGLTTTQLALITAAGFGPLTLDSNGYLTNVFPQSITFAALSDRAFGSAPFVLTASASSGLPVSYMSSNLDVATISGSTVTIVGVGTTTITASQGGSANFSAATSVLQTLSITQAPQSITFAVLPDRSFGSASFDLTATASSNLPISYQSSNPDVATISGSTVSIVGVGATTITASQAGDANYAAATSAAQTLTVTQASQVITFGALPDRAYGSAPFALTATASSNLPVSYQSSNSDVATISGSTVTIVGVGSTTITASQAGDSNYAAATNAGQTLTVSQASQTLIFATLPEKSFGDGSFALGASASSGLPVSYMSSNPDVATISGSIVTIVGAGTTTITANQVGDANYAAATAVGQALAVSQGSQTITFASLPLSTYGDAPFALTATTSSGLAVSYMSSNPDVATISGSTVTILGAGTTTITASQVGNSNYAAATEVAQTLTVAQASQTLTFEALLPKVYGDAPFALTASASSGLAVSYMSSNPDVATISGSTVTILGAGSTTITASQVGNSNYAAATEVAQTLTVAQASQTLTFDALPAKVFGDTPFALTATSSSGLAVSYMSSNPDVATISGSTVTILGAGSTTITASQVGNSNYAAATEVAQTLTVAQASQSFTFEALLPKVYGDAPFALTASASSGLAVTYESSNPLVASVSGSIVTIVGTGSTTITALQAGDTNHAPATSIQQVLTVNQASQTLSFADLPTMTYGDTPFTLTATASSALPVSYESSNPEVAIVSGSTLTLIGAGSTTITASQAGDANHAAATSILKPLIVNQASQVITFEPLPVATLGDSAIALTATTSSGLAVSYTSSNPTVATISGSTVILVGVGTTTITAQQNGDANYLAATDVPQTLDVLTNLDTPVIYEPFADTQSTLSGNTPGAGLSGTWISGGMNVSPTGLTYGTLPTSGGLAIKPSGNGSANASVAISQALNNAQLLNNGATLWFSFLYKRPATSGTNDQCGFAIGDSSLSSTGDTMGAGNNGFGVFLSRSARVQASYWNNGARTSASPSTNVIAANATVLVVGKIVWNGNSAAPDTLQLYLPSANLLQPVTPHSTTSFILNQATFDTLSFGGKNTTSPTIDEIRFGATYNSVTGQVGTASSGVITLTAYETWSAAYGGGEVIGSPSDDHDSDGVANLVEYALGTSPNSSASTPAVRPEVAGNRLRLKFTPQVVSGVSYTIQSSSDLSEWTDTLIPSASLSSGEPFTYIDSVDISTSTPPQRFLRLQIAAP